MKRMICFLLVLTMLAGLFVLPVCAQSVPDKSTVQVYGDQLYANAEKDSVEVYGQEDAGFFGWLKSLWQWFTGLFEF